VIFSSIPDDLGLYDKPMARNVQLWMPDGELLLDGPTAEPAQIKHAMKTVQAGGLFGYRFLFPPMRVGQHEVYWHRPLAAYHCPETDKPVALSDAPMGYLTAYPAGGISGFRSAFRILEGALHHPIELWPRFHRRPLPLAFLPMYHLHGRGPTD